MNRPTHLTSWAVVVWWRLELGDESETVVVGGGSWGIETEFGESDLVGVTSKYTGFKQSIETTYFQLLMLKVKCFLSRLRTSYRPLYGGCRGFLIASCRTNTWVQVCSSLWMLVCWCFCWHSGMALSFYIRRVSQLSKLRISLLFCGNILEVNHWSLCCMYCISLHTWQSICNTACHL